MWIFFFFQAEDGIRDLVRSRGLGDVYKRQIWYNAVIRGDVHYIRIGNRVNVQDGAVIHCTYQKLSLIHI